jgi:hypothetical protein
MMPGSSARQQSGCIGGTFREQVSREYAVVCESRGHARDLGGKGCSSSGGLPGIDPTGCVRHKQVEASLRSPSQKERRRRAGFVVRISLPPGAPTWLVGLSLAGILLVGLVYALVRLVRVALPDSPAERLDWWKSFWRHRRDLRHDRWRRRDQRRVRHRSSRQMEVDAPRLEHHQRSAPP